jgi:adenylosuccinate lyase
VATLVACADGGEKELGVGIPDEAVKQLRAHLDDADLDKAADYERRLRHDVMAHIHHLGDQAPAARPSFIWARRART